jgi:hypothetical protein
MLAATCAPTMRASVRTRLSTTRVGRKHKCGLVPYWIGQAPAPLDPRENTRRAWQGIASPALGDVSCAPG